MVPHVAARGRHQWSRKIWVIGQKGLFQHYRPKADMVDLSQSMSALRQTAGIANAARHVGQMCHSGPERTHSHRVNSCLKSRPSRTWPQPSHNHFVRRSAATWQAVSLDRGSSKSQCLLAGLPFRARKRHPLANDGTAHCGFGHLDFLSRSQWNPSCLEESRVAAIPIT